METKLYFVANTYVRNSSGVHGIHSLLLRIIFVQITITVVESVGEEVVYDVLIRVSTFFLYYKMDRLI